jgi:hypothetical protein
MSSNLRSVKICAFCKQEFIARKTTTETCSGPCAKRFYRVKQRERAIRRAKILKKEALLLNVSPLIVEMQCIEFFGEMIE